MLIPTETVLSAHVVIHEKQPFTSSLQLLSVTFMLFCRLLLGVCSLFFAASGNLSAAIDLSIYPAWNGYYKLGKTTEIQFRLNDMQGGDIAIESGSLTSSESLSAGVPLVVSLPYAPGHSQLPAIEVYRADEPAIRNSQTPKLIATSLMHIAVVTDGINQDQLLAIRQTLHDSETTLFSLVNVQSLPRFAAGYHAIDLLFLSSEGIKVLEDRQLYALADYLAGCGKLIALHFSEPLFEKLKHSAGCNGDFLIGGSFADIKTSLIFDLLDKASVALPTADQLIAAAEKTESLKEGSLLVWFCLGYIFIGTGVSLLSSRRIWLFVLPLLVTGSILSVFYDREPDRRLIGWFETGAGQRQGRYSALLAMRGIGLIKEQVRLPLDILSMGYTGDSLQLIDSWKNSVELFTAHSLFSTQSRYWKSVVPFESPLSMAFVEDQLVITNNGRRKIGEGLIKWQGIIFNLPVLEPGQSWGFKTAGRRADESSLLKIFARQSKPYPVAAVIPFFPDFNWLNAENLGWLMIYPSDSRVRS